jgi:hypothetical protein
MLQALHVFWTYLIFQVIAQSLKKGGFDRDVRSSSSEVSEDDNEKKEK